MLVLLSFLILGQIESLSVAFPLIFSFRAYQSATVLT